MNFVSLKGTVVDDKPREPMQILIYIKQGTLIYFQVILCPGFLSIELAWVCCSFSWLVSYFPFSDLCTPEVPQLCHGGVGYLEHGGAGYLGHLHLVRLGQSRHGLAEVKEL